MKLSELSPIDEGLITSTPPEVILDKVSSYGLNAKRTFHSDDAINVDGDFTSENWAKLHQLLNVSGWYISLINGRKPVRPENGYTETYLKKGKIHYTRI